MVPLEFTSIVCRISRKSSSNSFHAQDLLLNSSSSVGQVPNFRQEIRQSHYRNDPVKYDLVAEKVCIRIYSATGGGQF